MVDKRRADLPLVILLAGGCTAAGRGELSRAETTLVEVTYVHRGTGPGAVMFTNDSGNVVEERRHEPFGVAIELADYRAHELGPLGQSVDSDTAWSFHGARWYQPEAARWLTIDPPTRTADPKYIAQPWSLHPYQYVDQNPVLYWDPDGRDKRAVDDADLADVLGEIRERSKRPLSLDDKVHKATAALHRLYVQSGIGRRLEAGIASFLQVPISELELARGRGATIDTDRQQRADGGWRDGFMLGAVAALDRSWNKTAKLKQSFLDTDGVSIDESDSRFAYRVQFNRALAAGWKYINGLDAADREQLDRSLHDRLSESDGAKANIYEKSAALADMISR